MRQRTVHSQGGDANLPVRPARNRRQQIILAKITGVSNNFITVQQIKPDGTLTGVDIVVDKGINLHHELISGATTDGPNQVSVTLGEETETWVVFPPLDVDAEVMISPIGYSTIMVNEGTEDEYMARYGLTSRPDWQDITNNLGGGA